MKALLDLIRALFDLFAPRRAPNPKPVSSEKPLVIGDLRPPAPIKPKVLMIIHNPTIQPGVKAVAAYRWNDPDKLAQVYIDDIKEFTHGYAQYEIVERIEIDGFPIKLDGFRYDADTFDAAWQSRQHHKPDDADYLALVKEFKMIERINDGLIDEVWLFGFPFCGYHESIMCGPGAFWCNAPPLRGTEQANRRFVIMGFNYERGVGEMHEDLGHRAESIMAKVYERVRPNLWEQFIRYDKSHPGLAECGNVHFAPNSDRDYDWGNPRSVPSRADTWFNFPDLSGKPRIMTCADWGNGDIREHHRWWFRRFPHVEGESGGVSWNWWEYVIDPNRVHS